MRLECPRGGRRVHDRTKGWSPVCTGFGGHLLIEQWQHFVKFVGQILCQVQGQIAFDHDAEHGIMLAPVTAQGVHLARIEIFKIERVARHVPDTQQQRTNHHQPRQLLDQHLSAGAQRSALTLSETFVAR